MNIPGIIWHIFQSEPYQLDWHKNESCQKYLVLILLWKGDISAAKYIQQLYFH